MASKPAKKKMAPKKAPTKAPQKKKAAPKKAVSKSNRAAGPVKKKGTAKKATVPPKKAAKKATAPTEKAAKGGAYVHSEKELCKFLGCSRSTVSRLKRKEGNPGATADGKYSRAAWKEFFEANKENYSIDDEELAGERRAKRELADVKLKRELFELEREQGQYLHVDEVVKIVSQAWSGAVQHLKDAEHLVAPLVAGLDVPEARRLIRQTHIDALQRFSLGEWAKKKAFWRTVYAQLHDLRETLNLGSGQSETSNSPATQPS
jgi:transcriptional regulator with XRE-family HTH domain